jgi:hypothetical protein
MTVTGGSTSSGGAIGSGGVATGGQLATGGSTGGTAGTGGSTGGTAGTGGATGGTAGTGGATGGTAGTGGATGGTAGTGGATGGTAGTGGATGGTAGTGGSSGGALSFATDVDPIIQANCSPCHTSNTPRSGMLDMATGAGYASLVGVASSTGVNYVTAGDSSMSYIINKLEGTGMGNQMPFGMTPLDAATIQTIKDWIDGGASQ